MLISLFFILWLHYTSASVNKSVNMDMIFAFFLIFYGHLPEKF